MFSKLHFNDILVLSVFFIAIVFFNVYILVSFNFYLIGDFVQLSLWPPEKQYDYIVVGAGTAGGIIAKRLAKSNYKVLVLEAGTYGASMLDIPAMGLMLQGSPYDWKYKTTSQAYSCGAFKKNRSAWPRGKIIGGSGRLNYMIYLRGHRSAYDKWFENSTNYNYENDVLWYFKKTENYADNLKSDNHGKTGYLTVSKLFFETELVQYFLSAVKNMGFRIGDLNDDISVGFMRSQVNSIEGQRWTTGHSLLHNLEPNIDIYCSAYVTKINLNKHNVAKSVQFDAFSETYTVKAKKGVILCAGSINTPKILMSSGIGPKHHLLDVNITPIVDLPVGENLRDHVTTGLDLVISNTTFALNLASMLSPFQALNYFLRFNSAWSSPGCEIVGFLNYQDFISGKIKPDSIPDLEIMMMPVSVSEDGGIHAKNTADFKETVWNKYFQKTSGEHRLVILPMILYPESKGNIRLKDNNPYSDPLINPNYLASRNDVVTLVNGVKFILKLIDNKEMKKFGMKINKQKFPSCENFSFGSDAYWECYVRQLTLTVYHPCGTCKMGNSSVDSEAVVDYEFQVINTKNLYVGDASVMPNIPGSNINAATAMLAERLVDVIKVQKFLAKGKSYLFDLFFYVKICRIF